MHQRRGLQDRNMMTDWAKLPLPYQRRPETERITLGDAVIKRPHEALYEDTCECHLNKFKNYVMNIFFSLDSWDMPLNFKLGSLEHVVLHLLKSWYVLGSILKWENVVKDSSFIVDQDDYALAVHPMFTPVTFVLLEGFKTALCYLLENNSQTGCMQPVFCFCFVLRLTMVESVVSILCLVYAVYWLLRWG